MIVDTTLDLQAAEQLRDEYVGKSLVDLPTPSALLDLSKVERNCTRMLEAVDTLQVGWRVHIKTHKTIELTKLQVGDGPRLANVIVSTIKEAENVVPLLLEMKKKTNRAVNVLYSFPLMPSCHSRLVALAKSLGTGGISVMVDHPHQLKELYKIRKESNVLLHVYIKIDMGYHRAGVPPQGQAVSQLISDLLLAEEANLAIFSGLYSHAGHSYYGDSTTNAIDLLRQEFEALFMTAEAVHCANPNKKLILSVGATPTATSVRNMLIPDSTITTDEQKAISALKATINTIKSANCEIELHAGVYPILDIQQLATHALGGSGLNQLLSWSDLGLTIIAEVASIYPARGEGRSPEALVAAGSLALGREPCKAYPGWGILSPWNITSASKQPPECEPEEHLGWQVGRISQEHGILTWMGDEKKLVPLAIGQKVRIWPNHACIAGACYDWYFVFDSELEGNQDKVIDVWPRWRGW